MKVIELTVYAKMLGWFLTLAQAQVPQPVEEWRVLHYERNKPVMILEKWITENERLKEAKKQGKSMEIKSLREQSKATMDELAALPPSEFDYLITIYTDKLDQTTEHYLDALLFETGAHRELVLNRLSDKLRELAFNEGIKGDVSSSWIGYLVQFGGEEELELVDDLAKRGKGLLRGHAGYLLPRTREKIEAQKSGKPLPKPEDLDIFVTNAGYSPEEKTDSALATVEQPRKHLIVVVAGLVALLALLGFFAFRKRDA